MAELSQQLSSSIVGFTQCCSRHVRTTTVCCDMTRCHGTQLLALQCHARDFNKHVPNVDSVLVPISSVDSLPSCKLLPLCNTSSNPLLGFKLHTAVGFKLPTAVCFKEPTASYPLQ